MDTCREVVKLVAEIQSLSGDTKMNRVVSRAAPTCDNHTGFKRSNHPTAGSENVHSIGAVDGRSLGVNLEAPSGLLTSSFAPFGR